ncbi:MAG TPA: tRNA (adenosine(37)-N6)-dimethylallyltransferase MiaA [Phycisphaerae bacterium]|nr:tRNA (adenosine(37)-N6)-dimethylallyltransferase MiaA [Phycisphaerae bacterium]
MPPKITFLLGCTACGKGALGRELARRIRADIISVDSMKVFRRMDIGTAKPTPAQRRDVPHHLIDVVEPWEEFSVASFLQLAEQAIDDIAARGRRILAVGGTALYIKALSEGLFEGPSADPAIRDHLHRRAAAEGAPTLHAELSNADPDAARRIHPNDLRRIVRALEVYQITGVPISELQTQWDRQRTQHPCVFLGLRREREDQSHRTNQRVQRMIEQGLVDEVRSLLALQRPLSTAARQALGYAEIIEHLQGRISLANAVEMIKINTRRFAKAQRTWFKRFRDTEWIDLAPDSSAVDLADQIVQRRAAEWSN